MKKQEWCWTSYRREKHFSRLDDDGVTRNMYLGRFITHAEPGEDYSVATIWFWAARPILALRAICQSCKDPLEFHNKQVN